jgi:hypothetical protein
MVDGFAGLLRSDAPKSAPISKSPWSGVRRTFRLNVVAQTPRRRDKGLASRQEREKTINPVLDLNESGKKECFLQCIFFRRMVLFRLDSSGLVAPLPVSLVADVILGADGFNASLFALPHRSFKRFWVGFREPYTSRSDRPARYTNIWHRLLNAVLFPFFDYRQLFFFTKARATL